MRFTHLHEAAAFASQHPKDWPYIAAGPTVPVLADLDVALENLNGSVMRLAAAYGQAIRNKGSLNEKQYPGRLERARGNPVAMRKVRSEQMGNRVRYECGRIGIHPGRNFLRDQIDRTEAAIKAVLAYVETLGKGNENALVRDVCLSNCLKARSIVNAAREVWEKASAEVIGRDSDITQGRSRQAMIDAFDELGKPEADRMLLFWNDDLSFVEKLAGSTNKDDELAALLNDFEAKFADAWEKLHEAKFDLFHLQQNRGTLNEDQYGAKIERAGDEEFERLYKAQQQLRQAHHSCMVSVRWHVDRALAAVEALAPLYEQVRDMLINDRPRIMNSYGGELIVFAVMNNCVAAEALIRDTRGRKAKEFADELAKDVTDGLLVTARDEAIAELKKR